MDLFRTDDQYISVEISFSGRTLGSEVFSRWKDKFDSSQRGKPGHCISGVCHCDISYARGHNAFQS
jgi:hypothetical protein